MTEHALTDLNRAIETAAFDHKLLISSYDQYEHPALAILTAPNNFIFNPETLGGRTRYITAPLEIKIFSAYMTLLQSAGLEPEFEGANPLGILHSGSATYRRIFFDPPPSGLALATAATFITHLTDMRLCCQMLGKLDLATEEKLHYFPCGNPVSGSLDLFVTHENGTALTQVERAYTSVLLKRLGLALDVTQSKTRSHTFFKYSHDLLQKLTEASIREAEEAHRLATQEQSQVHFALLKLNDNGKYAPVRARDLDKLANIEDLAQAYFSEGERRSSQYQEPYLPALIVDDRVHTIFAWPAEKVLIFESTLRHLVTSCMDGNQGIHEALKLHETDLSPFARECMTSPFSVSLTEQERATQVHHVPSRYGTGQVAEHLKRLTVREMSPSPR